jgi:hypothetical protein
MENQYSGTLGKCQRDDAETEQLPRSTPAFINWALVEDVAVALVVTAKAPVEVAFGILPSLFDRLTRPHQLLDQLSADVDCVLAGDTLAARRLREQLDVLVASFPELIGSHARAKVIVDGAVLAEDVNLMDEHRDEDTMSFDGFVRLGAAVTLATIGYPKSSFGAILDVVLGLAMLTSAADQLAKGLARRGPQGVADAFNKLRLQGHWAVATPPPMQTMMSGSLGGILGGFPSDGHTPGQRPLGGPIDPEDIAGFAKGAIERIRGRRGWDPEIWDGYIPWRVIVGLEPPEVIDRDEIRRAACRLALMQALKLRQESPPPPQPAVVVWSDTITGIIAPNKACTGDQIIISGSDFGAPDVNVGIVLPMADGCHAFAVPAADWTATAITVTLPAGIASGPVGLVDIDYVRRYDEWALRMNELIKSIIKNAECSRSKVPDVDYVQLFHTCAPLTPVNHLRAGLPVIWSFKANGADVAFVEPGQPFRLEWDLRNVDRFRLTRLSNNGPLFVRDSFVDNPPGTHYDLGPFTENRTTEATYELRVVGPCGEPVTAIVEARLRKVPILEIEGIEVTQAIQTFRDPSSPPNAIPLVAQKDTIVRMYVAVENLGGFSSDFPFDGVEVSGELMLVGNFPRITLPPLKLAMARPRAKISRSDADHTLNFRIPAAIALSSVNASLIMKVWTTKEVEAPPTGEKTRPTVFAFQPIAWVEKRPYKVRYVRISTNSSPALNDAEAREAIVRAFDLLPTIPTDLWPARLETWHTSLDTETQDGLHELLGHIDDQHDCSTFEWLPWGDDCPDADDAVWIGILPQDSTAGVAQTYQLDNVSRNTAIVHPEQTTIAHELGHTLKLNHVNPAMNCGIAPDDDDDFDTLPDGGAIRPGDAFDPHKVKVQVAVYDFMTYACSTWVSRATWTKLFDKF